MNNTLDIVKRQAVLKYINLNITDCTSGIGIVMTDRDRLRQILIIMLEDAINQSAISTTINI